MDEDEQNIQALIREGFDVKVSSGKFTVTPNPTAWQLNGPSQAIQANQLSGIDPDHVSGINRYLTGVSQEPVMARDVMDTVAAAAEQLHRAVMRSSMRAGARPGPNWVQADARTLVAAGGPGKIAIIVDLDACTVVCTGTSTLTVDDARWQATRLTEAAGIIDFLRLRHNDGHAPCCTTCKGTGATASAPCIDCYGTGHSHPIDPPPPPPV